jgi:hypothetical protein
MWNLGEIVLIDVSEERIAYILRVEDKKKSASEPAEQCMVPHPRRRLS